jgi:hypothetical protein
MNDHDAALDSIQTRIAQTAVWRRGLANRYPADPRNIAAADCLDALAQGSGRSVHGGTWEAIVPFVKTRMFDDVLNETSREVGFRRRPKDFNAYLVIVADKLDTRAGGAQ